MEAAATSGVSPGPANEVARLQALAQYLPVGAMPPGAFTHIAEMAVRLFHVPIALVNVVRAEYVETLAAVGEIAPGTSADRDSSLCSLAILNAEPTVFGDALQDPCTLANPFVTGQFGLRFYAAAPIVTREGHAIGAVCLVDKQPRTFSVDDQKTLVGLAQIVMEDIEARYSGRHLPAAG